ncbi:hypothetical protein LOK49_Contig235G00005 [Camellia lanceoleosa]|nr:hypothetical protein LOK49_Contig235G00005 [Camellia lanceoleosa]
MTWSLKKATGGSFNPQIEMLEHKISLPVGEKKSSANPTTPTLSAAAVLPSLQCILQQNNMQRSGVQHALNPDPYRGVFGLDGEKYARDVEDLITFGTSGHVAGFISEAIQNEHVSCYVDEGIMINDLFLEAITQFFSFVMIKKFSQAIISVLSIGFLGWLFQATRPLPSNICGSPGGPPIMAPRIKLRDGRHLAYQENGVSKEMAKRNGI